MFDISSFGSVVGIILILASSTTAAGFISALFQKRKMAAESIKIDADAVHVLSQAAISMVSPLRTQIEELSEKLEHAHQRINELEFQVETVTNKMLVAQQELRQYKSGGTS